MLRKFLIGFFVIIFGLWLNNTSLLAKRVEGVKPTLLAHRGVHQTFDRTNVGNDTCTAQIIDPPQHDFLENTIISMRAAFEHGAQIVEIDVHLTPDGKFAVFHDYTLDCRTDGTGNTHDALMSDLKKLDIGYGYTFDGGKTYPFRGKGIGMMPSLIEVFEALPDGQFLINFKSKRVKEGQALAALLNGSPKYRAQVFGVYGGAVPTYATVDAVVGMRGYDRGSVKACLKSYAMIGWSGYMPESCQNTVVAVPMDYAPYFWGWPHKFTARMHSAGTEVILVGPLKGTKGSGIDTTDQAAQVPAGFDGIVWTDRIEQISIDMFGK